MGKRRCLLRPLPIRQETRLRSICMGRQRHLSRWMESRQNERIWSPNQRWNRHIRLILRWSFYSWNLTLGSWKLEWIYTSMTFFEMLYKIYFTSKLRSFLITYNIWGIRSKKYQYPYLEMIEASFNLSAAVKVEISSLL